MDTKRVLMAVPSRMTQEGEQNHLDFVSSNPRVRRIHELAGQIADTDVPVLIEGETGVGKEVLARSIHARSERLHRSPSARSVRTPFTFQACTSCNPPAPALLTTPSARCPPRASGR